MKKVTLILGLVAAMALGACSRVTPGHVGVKVEQYGSSAGVSNTALPVGTYFTMLGTTIYEYPVFTNTYAWTATKSEGKDADESFQFQDQSGLTVDGDVSVAYRVDPTKAPILFQKYRTDMAGIIAGPVRNAVRSALAERASRMTVEQIYGPQKTNLINGALGDVRRYFEPLGLHIEQLYWASAIRIPQSILSQINAKIANEQQALAAQANVATVEADGRAKVAKAEADAKATQIEGEALRTNPEILQQRAIEKWNGVLPQYTGGGQVPFIKVN
jgi:regulator of protease activity HflC (stomatin/prohibitin superfamily)